MQFSRLLLLLFQAKEVFNLIFSLSLLLAFYLCHSHADLSIPFSLKYCCNCSFVRLHMMENAFQMLKEEPTDIQT